MKKVFPMPLAVCAILLFPLVLTAGLPEFLVIGKEPSGFEKNAADELREFFGKIYGKSLQVVPENESVTIRNAIYLGQTGFAQKHGVDGASAGREEWILKTVGDNLIISGGRPVGTLYGVYALLEKLGVSFLTMDETVIPKNNPTFPVLDERAKPAFDGRQIFDNFAREAWLAKASPEVVKQYNHWLLRSRINGYQYPKNVPIYVGGIYNISHDYKCHSLSHYVNPDKYFKDHPEYFSMNEQGNRFKPKSFGFGGGLCMSNREVWKITLDSLREMIRKDRKERNREDWPYVYDISTLDASPYICKCPECMAVTREEGSETGLLLRYINHVATEIRKEYPEIIIRTFGYSASRNAPTRTMPAENVLIFLTDQFTASDPFRPLTSKMNESRIKYFNTWKATGAKFMIWDYWNISCDGVYYNPPRVETIFDAIQPDIRLFHSFGAIALFLEAERDPLSPQNFMDLNYFVANRLMVNPEENAEHLADTFLKGYYSSAAPSMKKWFDFIRAGVRVHPIPQTTSVVGAWNYITPEFMLDSYRMLKKTADSLPENSVYRKRVQFESITPIWAVLANWSSYAKIFQEAGIRKEYLVRECSALVRMYIRRYPCANPGYYDKMYSENIKGALLELPRPEKFKNVPNENFRMIAYPHFNGVVNLGSGIVDDSDSITGKALKSANWEPAYHGVNKLLPGPDKFRTTHFQFGNHKAEGRISVTLTEVPQDEKYHWFRIPGKIELKRKSYFWGQGWAIQADTSHWYMLTDGSPEDNTWDEIWFSAKFTGPAYVRDSKKENAIYVDMVVAIRSKNK